MNIIEHWLSAYSTIHEAIADLSNMLGQTITVSRFGEFRRGDRPLPEKMHQAMLPKALPVILTKHGIDAESVDCGKLADDVMPPRKTTQHKMITQILLIGGDSHGNVFETDSYVKSVMAMSKNSNLTQEYQRQRYKHGDIFYEVATHQCSNEQIAEIPELIRKTKLTGTYHPPKR